MADMESKNFYKASTAQLARCQPCKLGFQHRQHPPAHVQLFKDSGLIDKVFTQTDCDLIFTKARASLLALIPT